MRQDSVLAHCRVEECDSCGAPSGRAWCEIDPREQHYSNTPLGVADHYQHREMIDFLSEYSRDVWELTYLGKLDRLRAVLAEDPRRARVAWEKQTR
jgi:hypothetical protein